MFFGIFMNSQSNSYNELAVNHEKVNSFRLGIRHTIPRQTHTNVDVVLKCMTSYL